VFFSGLPFPVFIPPFFSSPLSLLFVQFWTTRSEHLPPLRVLGDVRLPFHSGRGEEVTASLVSNFFDSPLFFFLPSSVFFFSEYFIGFPVRRVDLATVETLDFFLDLQAQRCVSLYRPCRPLFALRVLVRRYALPKPSLPIDVGQRFPFLPPRSSGPGHSPRVSPDTCDFDSWLSLLSLLPPSPPFPLSRHGLSGSLSAPHHPNILWRVLGRFCVL